MRVIVLSPPLKLMFETLYLTSFEPRNAYSVRAVEYVKALSVARAQITSGRTSNRSTTRYAFGAVTHRGSPYAKAIFSKDFRLAGLDGCHLTLKNTTVSVIDFWRQTQRGR